MSTRLPADPLTSWPELPDGPSTVLPTREVPLANLLARDMSLRWQAGERPQVEDYLLRHPELASSGEAVLDLVYEEICQRRRYEAEEPPDVLLSRFPQHRAALERLLACDRAPDDEGPATPRPGEVLGGFRLLSELGRGAEAQVFLAAEEALADRRVVLKLVPMEAKSLGVGEHLSLARLQHTHIVPLYGVHDEEARGLRLLCMPYFGSATLGRWLHVLARNPGGEAPLLAALDGAQAAEVSVPDRSPARAFLAQNGRTRALCWVAARLAEGLHYAHERGLVHLDVKPSNVLLAADGQPMLLDFHLARPPVAAGSRPNRLGGTALYMAPEHEAALTAVAEARPVRAAVDARSDLFSLGAVLYEALGGTLPYREGASPPLSRVNPDVSAGLSDVVAKCLATDPARRYADGLALAADLGHHLAHRPLAGVRNRSPRERWYKWRQRKPAALYLYALGLMAAAGLAAAAGAGAYLLRYQHEPALRSARTMLEAGRGQYRGDPAAAAASFARGLEAVEGVPGSAALADELRREQRRALRRSAAGELRRLADRVRALYPFDLPPGPPLADLDARCRVAWERRGLMVERLEGDDADDDADRDASRTDLLDLALLLADLRVKLAGSGAGGDGRREALALLDEAGTLAGRSPVLASERRRHGGDAATGRAAGLPQSAWECYALGRACLRASDEAAAAAHFDEAVRRAPNDFWANFYQGRCCHLRKRYVEAVAAFSVCAGAGRGVAACYFNRALAYAALGQNGPAVRDYTTALGLDPSLAAAALNRGMLHYSGGRLRDARADLEQALKLGADPASAHYDLALVYLADRDRVSALASVRKSLAADGTREEAAQLRDRLIAELRGITPPPPRGGRSPGIR